jgi:hypothetical protein
LDVRGQSRLDILLPLADIGPTEMVWAQAYQLCKRRKSYRLGQVLLEIVDCLASLPGGEAP